MFYFTGKRAGAVCRLAPERRRLNTIMTAAARGPELPHGLAKRLRGLSATASASTAGPAPARTAPRGFEINTVLQRLGQ